MYLGQWAILASNVMHPHNTGYVLRIILHSEKGIKIILFF